METQTGLGATTQGQLRRKTSQNWSYNAIMFSVVLTRRTCPTTPASTTSTLSGSLSPLPFSCFPLSYSPFFRGQFSRFHIRDYQGRYFSTGRGKTNILWNGWAGQGWGVLKILRSQIEIYDGTSRDLWIQNPFVGFLLIRFPNPLADRSDFLGFIYDSSFFLGAIGIDMNYICCHILNESSN